jgi:protein-tyrosine phosphatase
LIDLHCHILQKIDDGPQILEESLKMARAYSAIGYRVAAATPHMIPGTTWMPSVDRIKRKITALNRALEQEGLDFKIVSGMEIALDPQIPNLLDEGRLLCLGNSSFLLMEPPFQRLPQGWEQLMFSVLSKGYSILLAHPERCQQLSDKPPLIEQLIETGVHLQANWGSFLGRYGRTVARTAHLMAKKGWIHCLATDSHSPRNIDPAEMQAAKDRLSNLIGPDNLQLIARKNPVRVLWGEAPKGMKKTDSVGRRRKARRWKFWESNCRRQQSTIGSGQ